jgi:hypothetical protein
MVYVVQKLHHIVKELTCAVPLEVVAMVVAVCGGRVVMVQSAALSVKTVRLILHFVRQAVLVVVIIIIISVALTTVCVMKECVIVINHLCKA